MQIPKSAYKEFEQVEYDKHDDSAKQAVIKYIKKTHNYQIIDKDREDDEWRGPDLWIVELKCYAEAEQKKGHLWGSGPYPARFRSGLHIPFRKQKYLKYGTVFYFVCSWKLDRAMITAGHNLREEYLIDVPNYKKEDEVMFNVPLKFCKEVRL